jgi:hypothetical protein
MALSRIILRLARNPGTEFAEGDEDRGYVFTAPLRESGLVDEDAYSVQKAQCVVRRFAPDEAPVEGRLSRRRADWFFDYDQATDTDDEPVYRLGQHAFLVGEYVTISDEHHRPLTYKVAEVQPIR